MNPTRRSTFALCAMIGLLGSSAAPAQGPTDQKPTRPSDPARLFARKNLIAWCIVPFDSKKRSPAERAEMLQRLGFEHFAYDWRAEHVPTFDQEVVELKKRGVSLDAWWVAPGELNRESKAILDVLARRGVKAQLWVLLDFGGDKATGDEQNRRVRAAADKLAPLAKAANAIGCTLALYNHGGWFGEPENQIEIIERLKSEGVNNVGIVYNLHHGHEHLDRFPALLKLMKPHLLALNLNGMDVGGDKIGRKILPLGQGELDLELLRTIVGSGYDGPIGILGHTMDDAEERLKDNLDGLDHLVERLQGKPARPLPKPRTPVPPRPAKTSSIQASPALDRVPALVEAAAKSGDARRGAAVFSSPLFGCTSCHRIGSIGGRIGPDLSELGRCRTAESIVESLLDPQRQVALEFQAIAAALSDGSIIRGYKQADRADSITIRDGATDEMITVEKSKIEEIKPIGSLMPERLAAGMTDSQLADLIRFLTELGKGKIGDSSALLASAHAPARFPFENGPRRPADWPNARAHVNRDRVYEFYTKEAEYYLAQSFVPSILPPYCGIDGGSFGHWGNQNDEVWKDGRWNGTDLGRVISGIFRGGSIVVPKGVCVRLGDRGEAAICFNPESLTYDALWTGGFVEFSPVRHGFMNGLLMKGELAARPEGSRPAEPFQYRGFHRVGDRVVFAYRIGSTEYLDAPWYENGRFTRIVGPAASHPLRDQVERSPARRLEELVTKIERGNGRPYAVDTIEVPFDNPWKALMFFGDHAFLADGSALLCTMQGDVWRVSGLELDSSRAVWRRVASGLHQALGIVVSQGEVFVLGRDQITRLHDRNDDGEYDFYECVNNSYPTSPAGHDFVAGLERTKSGEFLTATGHLGLIAAREDGSGFRTIATGFRNPDGLGLRADGTITVPCSEGEWTPASMICEIRQGGFYGYGGPRDKTPPDLPLVYIPRGLDNSSGGQCEIIDDRWGPLRGVDVHLSFGTGTHFLLLRERIDGQSQGALVPLTGDFRSGVHRARFNPADGQLYVSGMAGWGSYTPDDGCFQRVRWTGEPVSIPKAFHVHRNGIRVEFTDPVDPAIATSRASSFAQAWNYRYSAAYGSPELSPSHPTIAGHDSWAIRSVHLLDGGRSVFYEIPEIQPVNQLHLYMKIGDGISRELFLTIHRLGPDFESFPGYRTSDKTIAAHPIARDLALMEKARPNPWRARLAGSREITIAAGPNLSFAPRTLTAKRGEAIRLVFQNPDVVPHNWVLIAPGSLEVVGDLANKIIADPDAFVRHYVPNHESILVYSDIVSPGDSFAVNFHAPKSPGRYPYMCTFPGHWMVMNGVLIVE
ncbi:MAG: plastocyanin/azurin family copper-binding protein [Isosphaeraceae bacterium]|nr:plastocyanin/azurin family copper-binding protein [Isosphaeraceae bacterium]